MKIVLLTTSILTEQSVEYLNRLYSSVSNSIISGIVIEHVMLLQNPHNYRVPTFERVKNYNLTILIEGEQLSLSEARNRMLSFIKGENLIAEIDVVGFPDDDCWYPNENLAFIFKQFQRNKELGLFFCKYCEIGHDVPNEQDIFQNIGATEVVRNASSNTIFVRGSTVNNLQGFDRELGVGAPNNGGEDLDYAIRAFVISRESAYLDRYIIGHRDKDRDLRGKYYRGSAIVLRRYMFTRFGLLYEALRKLTIGFVLTWKGEISIKEFISSLKAVEGDNQLL